MLDTYFGFECFSCGFGRGWTFLGPSPRWTAEMFGWGTPPPAPPVTAGGCPFYGLPDELLLVVVEMLSAEALEALARAWDRVRRLAANHDIFQQRRLHCFVLKTCYRHCTLGIGVAVVGPNVQRHIVSEFDLISLTAVMRLHIWRSIHGAGFEHWLPLALSRLHWQRVRDMARSELARVGRDARLAGPPWEVLFAFMDNLATQLNEDRGRPILPPLKTSTLRHVSERAIESYFHLFHLLLCMAVDDPAVVEAANERVGSFARGRTTKADCPSLGRLLIALLITDVSVDDKLVVAIIIEAIIRNVVWLLDRQGANLPELSYLEPRHEMSVYRLQKSFEGCRTSYRLLMFSELFRKAARPSSSRSLEHIRDELFDRHGAPPPGVAARMAAKVRRLHGINSFPKFLEAMKFTPPSLNRLSLILRQAVVFSASRGYSRWGLQQEEARVLRIAAETGCRKTSLYWPACGRFITASEIRNKILDGQVSFFPDNNEI